MLGGLMVGDDSVNRAIAGVRRIAAEVAPGAFEVETIPRTGYRLTGDIFSTASGQSAAAKLADRHLSRRTLVAGGAATTAALGAAGCGGWAADRPTRDSTR